MTVESTVNRVDIVAASGQTNFSFSFKYFNATDIRVFIDNVLQTTGFTVNASPQGTDFGGTVVFTAAPTENSEVALIRVLPLTQTSDYEEGDNLPSQQLEDDLDRQTMVNQQQQEDLTRRPALSSTSLVTNVVIVEPTTAVVGHAFVWRQGTDMSFFIAASDENVDEAVARIDTVLNQAQDLADASAASASASAASADASSDSAGESDTSATESANSATESGNSATESANSAAAAAASESNAGTIEATVIAQGNAQVQRVTAEGNTQVQRVTAEGNTQDSRVTSEGDTQVQRLISAGGIPTGLISLWSGSIASIPTGWVLCNGNNGTPDLRDRFVIGAGSSHNPGATGGTNSVTLSTSQMTRHRHLSGVAGADPGLGIFGSSTSGTPGLSNARINAVGGGASSQAITSLEGSSSSHENRPPFYALAYIMKL